MPYICHILHNCPVGAEDTGGGYIAQRHLLPAPLIPVALPQPLLCAAVAFKVSQRHIVVVGSEHLGDVVELLPGYAGRCV